MRRAFTALVAALAALVLVPATWGIPPPNAVLDASTWAIQPAPQMVQIDEELILGKHLELESGQRDVDREAHAFPDVIPGSFAPARASPSHRLC